MSERRPLQNRVDPFGELHAVAARGGLMGNRGGKFHDAGQRLGARRFVSRRWIACECEFRERRRSVWGDGYTELFFLDEVTALSAGHRPCFECRRADAVRFAALWGGDRLATANEVDRTLDFERRIGGSSRQHLAAIDELPDGAMIALKGAAFAILGARLLPWSFQGYGAALPRPSGESVETLTPPSICRVLARGYEPRWDHALTR